MSTVTTKKLCSGCRQELAVPEAFDPEYSNCRTYCCACCPDRRSSTCQKDALDKKNGKSFWDGFL